MPSFGEMAQRLDVVVGEEFGEELAAVEWQHGIQRIERLGPTLTRCVLLGRRRGRGRFRHSLCSRGAIPCGAVGGVIAWILALLRGEIHHYR